MRELSALFHRAGFWEHADDMVDLDRSEVRDALFVLRMGWDIGARATGAHALAR
jgi:pyruvate,water dikinase